MMSDKAKVEIVWVVMAAIAFISMAGLIYCNFRDGDAVQLECVKHGHTIKECQP